MARYEFVEGTSSKFWEIVLSGESFTVTYGRIGTNGQTQTKTFATAAAAKTEHDKLVTEKTKKGYAPVGEPAASTQSTDAPAPEAVADATAAPAQEAPAKKAPAKKSADAEAPAKPAKKAVEPVPAAPPSAPQAGDDGFLDAGNGYALGIADGKIIARNKAGKILASVPKEVKATEAYATLDEALEFFDQHERDCRDTVDTWMLRSLPVPRAVVEGVWADVTWRALLENAVVRTADGDGLLRGASERGLGLVTLDGDTIWVKPDTFTLPHPILLDELDEYRALLAEVGLRQGLQQLFRETFRKPAPPADGTEPSAYVSDWSGAEFEMLAQAMAEAKRGGWRVRGGASCCTTWEGGTTLEARYDLGEGDPLYETTTGSLYWVDADGEIIPRLAVSPVAWSEGMRMASAIHKKRKVEEKKDGNEDG
jgi:predicted DNA-binding WGR domain protein